MSLEVAAYLFLAMPRSEAASSEAPSATSSCPVIHAWAASEIVLKRLLEKDLLILSNGKLSRATVAANRELLVPLINLVGL